MDIVLRCDAKLLPVLLLTRIAPHSSSEGSVTKKLSLCLAAVVATESGKFTFTLLGIFSRMQYYWWSTVPPTGKLYTAEVWYHRVL